MTADQSENALSNPKGVPSFISDIAPIPPIAEGPSVVTELAVLTEIRPGDPSAWLPQSYTEWESRERTRTFLDAWSEQSKDERKLRRNCANWIFGLIAFQVIGVFALAIFQGIGWVALDISLLKVLLPSVLADVFGLGFVVAKYLFSQPVRHSLDNLASGGPDAGGHKPGASAR